MEQPGNQWLGPSEEEEGQERSRRFQVACPSGALSVGKMGVSRIVQRTVASASFGRVALATGDGSRGAELSEKSGHQSGIWEPLPGRLLCGSGLTQCLCSGTTWRLSRLQTRGAQCTPGSVSRWAHEPASLSFYGWFWRLIVPGLKTVVFYPTQHQSPGCSHP